MRTIDADQMRVDVVKECPECILNGSRHCKGACPVNEVTKAIDEAPTVEAFTRNVSLLAIYLMTDKKFLFLMVNMYARTSAHGTNGAADLKTMETGTELMRGCLSQNHIRRKSVEVEQSEKGGSET